MVIFGLCGGAFLRSFLHFAREIFSFSKEYSRFGSGRIGCICKRSLNFTFMDKKAHTKISS
ncbi:hypothetical protein SUBVAR_05730 [Subdoligranulum variabile DSM 15176]|uniref:Uncharacterized protein n=1 Tax=Subdoligranulum variabile DSM 15176 TaxID=411471 RepID=D1PN15_9FIRM|nr:hypothetical protein SUBVAR_05730 [Subdoligranulum variabile DSM 15176]